MRKIYIKKLREEATLPDYAHIGDAGFDLYSAEDVIVPTGKWKLVQTGLQIRFPRGTEGQIRTKSGVALKNGVFVLNSPATIDENYEGEIGIILMNLSDTDFVVKRGQKVAQMVINEVVYCDIRETQNIKPRGQRGNGGFGSSGLTKK